MPDVLSGDLISGVCLGELAQDKHTLHNIFRSPTDEKRLKKTFLWLGTDLNHSLKSSAN